MRQTAIAGSLLLLLVLPACPLGGDSDWTLIPLDEPVELEVRGAFVHVRTGMRFPKSLGDFHRRDVSQFDRDGLDVCVRYDLYPGGTRVPGTSVVALTVKVSPALRDSEDQLDAVGQQILASYEGAELLDQGDILLLQDGNEVSGLRTRHRILFRTPLSRIPKLSDTLLFRRKHGRSSWFVKYRISYPEAQEPAVREHIDGFLKALPIP